MRAPKTPNTYQVKTSAERSSELAKINHWNLQGAVSIRGPRHTDIVQVSWQQHGRDYQINISGPLSVGTVRLIGRPGAVILEKSAKETYKAKTPEALMQAQLGWHLPVLNLIYWVRGIANPKLPAKSQYDSYGHLINLSQQGWQIHYQRFQRVNQLDLPSIIVLNSPKLNVKMVIKRWQI